jgi:hypothetical protein
MESIFVEMMATRLDHSCSTEVESLVQAAPHSSTCGIYGFDHGSHTDTSPPTAVAASDQQLAEMEDAAAEDWADLPPALSPIYTLPYGRQLGRVWVGPYTPNHPDGRQVDAFVSSTTLLHAEELMRNQLIISALIPTAELTELVAATAAEMQRRNNQRTPRY